MLNNFKIFPVEFTPLEQAQALVLLDEANRASITYKGIYQSSWLLCDVHSKVWRISKGNETRDFSGEIKGFYEYNWATKLYDGTELTDKINQGALHGLQRLAFLARELPRGPDTLSTYKNFLWSLNFLIRWCYLHSDILNPRQYLFSKLEHNHFVDLFTQLGEGGTAFALRYPEQFIRTVFPFVLGRDPSLDELANPLSINLDDRKSVRDWFSSHGEMERVTRTERNFTVKKSTIARLLGVDVKFVRGGQRWRVFLNQFSISDELRDDQTILTSSRREHKSQRDLSSNEMRDSGTKEKTLQKYYDDIKHIVSLHRNLPNFCPHPIHFNPKKLRRVIIEVSVVSSRTPWIPLDIALAYTTQALQWIHVYGKDLVTTFLYAYRELHARGLLISGPEPDKEAPTKADYVTAARSLAAARDKFVQSLEIPESLRALKLEGWGCHVHLNGNKAFSKLRDNPSLLDALMILVGAITIVVATMKPIRESEFRALKRDCLLFVDGDGYWLSQDVRKKNVGDVWPKDARPIPTVAATALQLLKVLTDELKNILNVKDPWILDSLLTLPSFGRYEAEVDGTLSTHQLNGILDAFCDHVALPPDATGRRWYLRIHEMRKSFLITFFWMYRYSNLDAARWIAGHNNPEHLYTYIQANFPGDELPAIEAEYASQILRDYDRCSTSEKLKNIDALHQEVCTHFSVGDVSLVDDETLRAWLEIQFSTGEFEILPYSIKNPDGGLRTEIGFRITPI